MYQRHHQYHLHNHHSQSIHNPIPTRMIWDTCYGNLPLGISLSICQHNHIIFINPPNLEIIPDWYETAPFTIHSQFIQLKEPVTEILLLTSLWAFANCAGCQNIPHLLFDHHIIILMMAMMMMVITLSYWWWSWWSRWSHYHIDDDYDDDYSKSENVSHHSAVVLVASLFAVVATVSKKFNVNVYMRF